MKTIFEYLNVTPSDQFQLIGHDINRRVALVVAPEGESDVLSAVSDYPAHTAIYVILPQNSKVSNLLAKYTVGSKQDPGLLGMTAGWKIIDESYDYGVIITV